MSLQFNSTSSTRINLGVAESSILRLLMYFDVFQYPLLQSEVIQLLSPPNQTSAAIQEAVDSLVSNKMILREKGFLRIREDSSCIKRRIKGNIEAERYFKKAKSIAGILSSFPFVRSVMLSGSLSKGYMDEGSDVDFFIITEKGRLWLCRSLLAFARKLLPGSLKKYCCINYFIDTSSLAIPDKNFFTATELAFLYPVFADEWLAVIHSKNEWFREFYPSPIKRSHFVQKSPYLSMVKRFLEWTLGGKVGDWLEAKFFNFMKDRWQKRYNLKNDGVSDVNIRTNKNVSKHHEKGHQFIVLSKVQESVQSFNDRHLTNLSL